MKQNLIRVAAVLLSASALQSAYAIPIGGLPPTPVEDYDLNSGQTVAGQANSSVGLQNSATLTYGGQTISGALNNGAIAQADNAFYNEVTTVFDNEVGNVLGSEISANGGQLQGYAVTLSGPFNLNVLSSGAFTLSLPQTTLNLVLYAAHFEGPIKIGVTCNIAEMFPAPAVTGSFNPSTGGLSNLQANLSTPTQTVSCTSDLALPILSSYIDSQAQQAVSSEFSQAIAQMGTFDLNNIGGSNSGTLGLPKAMPAGIFVINGTDYGAQIENDLPNIIASGGLNVTIDQIAVPAQTDGFTWARCTGPCDRLVTVPVLSGSIPALGISASISTTFVYGGVPGFYASGH